MKEPKPVQFTNFLRPEKRERERAGREKNFLPSKARNAEIRKRI
jgi:hypothetical protein